jgi:2-(1,2-epoxy-1,2-dihydrophenyl)acetyl-CoA isomerase
MTLVLLSLKMLSKLTCSEDVMANEITTEIRGNAVGSALIVTFNRPNQGNALSKDMANQLHLAIKNVVTDRAIRAIMLRGAGGNFMDGLDWSIYGGELMSGVEQNNELLLPYNSAVRELHGMDKPILAVVSGKVTGPGLSLMLASDMVLAGRGAQFTADFSTHAMTPDGGASFFLPRKVGAAKATEILMLGETFDAAEAERLQLVNKVVDDAKLEEEAFQWIDRLANGPTKAYGGIKRLIGKAFEQDINTHMGLEHTYWGACARSFDFRSATKAQLTKKPVIYSGA